MREDAYTPLVNCIVNDGLVNAMPNMQQTLLQFINVVHPRLIDSALDDVSHLVVDRVEVRTVRWPHIRWNESSVACSRSRTVSDLPEFEVVTFARYCRNIPKVWWEVLQRVCWKLSSLYSSERILKISYELTKLSPWVGCILFGTQCISNIESLFMH